MSNKVINQVIIIPGELSSLNEYIEAYSRNKFMGAKMKKQNTEHVKNACLNGDYERVECKCDYSFVWYVTSRRKDPDNISFAKKFVLDGLVWADIIPNDSQKYVGQTRDICKVDKENPRVEILMYN